MPQYDFVCDTCGNTETETRRIADRDNNPPMCQHGEVGHPLTHAMRRTISRDTGFSLKGGGWYKDGYSKNTGTGQ